MSRNVNRFCIVAGTGLIAALLLSLSAGPKRKPGDAAVKWVWKFVDDARTRPIRQDVDRGGSL